MLTSLRRYRLPAAFAVLGLLLSAFAPCAMPMMAHGAAPPAESNEAAAPCHDATEHEAPGPVVPSEAPCAQDDCCAFRVPTAPRTEQAPDLTASSIPVPTAAVAVLPIPVSAPLPAPLFLGSSPPTVPFSILYGCFLT